MTRTITTYRENTDTTEPEHNSIQALNTEDVELQEVINNCKEHGVDADLYDEAGFRKGRVHADVLRRFDLLPCIFALP